MNMSQLNLVEILRKPGSVTTIELRPPEKGITESSDTNRLATINYSMQDLVLNDFFVFLIQYSCFSISSDKLSS